MMDKYEKALETAMHYYQEMEGDICSVLEECFPELEGRLDEKIRKRLLELFKGHHADEWYGLKVHDVIAWLEKLKPSAAEGGESAEYWRGYWEGEKAGMDKCAVKPEDAETAAKLTEFLDDLWHRGRSADFDKWGKADCADWIAWVGKQKSYSNLEKQIEKACRNADEHACVDTIVVKDYRVRDTWEYLDEFVKKFGRYPKDADEISACIDYVIKRRPVDEAEVIRKHITDDSLSKEVKERLEQCSWFANKMPDWEKEKSIPVAETPEREEKPVPGAEEEETPCGMNSEESRQPIDWKDIRVGDVITYYDGGKKGILLVSSFDGGIYPRCKWGITTVDGSAYGDWAPGAETYYAATEGERRKLYGTMPEYVKDWFENLQRQK